MAQIVLLNLLKSLLSGVLTEKFLMNLVLMLAKLLTERTSNDLDDQLLKNFKEALDKRQGTPAGNLYDRVKSKL